MFEMCKYHIQYQIFQTAEFRTFKLQTINFGYKTWYYYLGQFQTNILAKDLPNILLFSLFSAILPTLTEANVQKWGSTEPLLKEFLAKSLLIDLLSTLLVEDKVKVRILPSMSDKIGP